MMSLLYHTFALNATKFLFCCVYYGGFMKRITIFLLALVLVLPLLFVSALAAPASIVVDGVVVDSSTCSFDVSSVPAGSYYLSVSFIGTEIAYSAEPVYLPGTDALFDFYACSDILGECLVVPCQVASGQFYVPNFFEFETGSHFSMTFVPAYSSILSDFTSVISAVIDWVGQIAAAIVEHPFLLVTVGIFFVGGCIALFGRLLSRN